MDLLKPFFSGASEAHKKILEQEGGRILTALGEIIDDIALTHGLVGRLNIAVAPISEGVDSMHPAYYITLSPKFQIFGYPRPKRVVSFHPGSVDDNDGSQVDWSVNRGRYWTDSAQKELESLKHALLSMRRDSDISRSQLP